MHPISRCAKLAPLLFFVVVGASLASSISPEASKKEFEDAKKNAEIVADVRVLSAVCTESEFGGQRLTLHLSLHVLESAKGPAKKNDVLVVTYKVKVPSRPGILGMYGYNAAARQFPFTPGVKGNVALKWDKEKRQYVAIAGWVQDPNFDTKAIPREVGQAIVAKEPAKQP